MRNRTKRGRVAPLALCWAVVVAWGCDDRSAAYEAIVDGDPVGLEGSVAVPDARSRRIAFVTAQAPPGSDSGDAVLDTQFFRTRKGVRAPIVSIDRQRLYLLSEGDSVRVSEDDERPALTVFSGGTEPSRLGVIELDTAFDSITEDPSGNWLVLSNPSGAGVSNPNEFTLVDVSEENLERDEPVVENVTIRSFGSRPKRFTFTDELDVPGGSPRRFLAVETDFDLALLDLENLERGDVTIPLPQSESTGRVSSPAQVSVFAGSSDADFDGLLAVRFSDSASLLLVGFAESAGKPFEVTLNLVNVGGVPTDLDFVETDGGLRLAALVPARREAVLVDLGSTVTTSVPLPGALTTMRVVTEDVFSGDVRGDVALLWSAQAAEGIAFWSLGETADRAFRSIEGSNVDVAVRRVIDIPGDDYAHRKLLETTSSEFYVLDLQTRTSFPMTADRAGLELSVSRDGRTAVAFAQGADWFSTIDLGGLHAQLVNVERPLAGVFDIEAASGEPAMVAFHRNVGLSATLFDGAEPDSVRSRHFAGLMLADLPLDEDLDDAVPSGVREEDAP